MGKYWMGTAADVAARLNVSRSIAYRWLNAGRLGAVKIRRECVKCIRSGVRIRCDLCQIEKR